MTDHLAEVRAATDAKAEAEARWLAAVRAAFDADTDRTALAQAAGFDRRDAVYKLLRRRAVSPHSQPVADGEQPCSATP